MEKLNKHVCLHYLVDMSINISRWSPLIMSEMDRYFVMNSLCRVMVIDCFDIHFDWSVHWWINWTTLNFVWFGFVWVERSVHACASYFRYGRGKWNRLVGGWNPKRRRKHSNEDFQHGLISSHWDFNSLDMWCTRFWEVLAVYSAGIGGGHFAFLMWFAISS